MCVSRRTAGVGLVRSSFTVLSLWSFVWAWLKRKHVTNALGHSWASSSISDNRAAAVSVSAFAIQPSLPTLQPF